MKSEVWKIRGLENQRSGKSEVWKIRGLGNQRFVI
jgi:hypothetical protein